jgi:CheY-like chemotaxis protein
MRGLKPDTKTILVADDSAAQRRFLEILLGAEGYRVVTMEDGLEVVTYLETNTADLIIVDVNMPYMNGLEVCEACKAALAGTPVIVLTGMHDDKTAMMARQVKADAFVTKPLLGNGFRRLVEKMLYPTLAG